MATEVNNQSHTPIFTTVERDDQWEKIKCRIHNVDLTKGVGLVQIQNKNVTCTGSFTTEETLFKVHSGGTDDINMMFECIGGSSSNMMICVNSSNELTARVKEKDYINLDDAEPDVLFTPEMHPDVYARFKLKWKKGGTYVAFDGNGQPMLVGKEADGTLFDIREGDKDKR